MKIRPALSLDSEGADRPGNAPARTQSGRFTDLDSNKLRGGYYTSAEIADWLCAWAIRKASDKILEPSCGDGVFLESAAARLLAVGASGAAASKQLTGIEIIRAEVDRARARLRKHVGARATNVVINEDFFAWSMGLRGRSFNAVVGNPPFIRYQTFPEPYRSRAMAMMKRAGLTPNKLTNIWVPFVVGATEALLPGGRLALVLPAELLQVSYSSQLRTYLTDRFKRIDIVACNQLIFANAEQEVVLLMADGALASASATNECRVAMTETHTVSEITRKPPKALLASAVPKTVRHDHEKWLKYFLSEREISFMRSLRASKEVTALIGHASIDVGVVTGKNEFFVLDREQARHLGVEQYTIPLVSRSSHLRGAKLNAEEWKELGKAGDRVLLLDLTPLNGSRLTGKLRSYIQLGEEREIHKGYKCSIRTPWYAVPSIWTPDGFAFRQIYDFPRLVLNRADATSTDTIHRLSCKSNPEKVIANCYTHLLAASAEIEGRSYGGGVLELEPTEAERLLMPAQLQKAASLTEVDKLIRAGRLDAVLHENDRLILMEGMGLSKDDCATLRAIWVKMRNRRLARSPKGRRQQSIHATP
jgi:adenine-specific DNA methylase